MSDRKGLDDFAEFESMLQSGDRYDGRLDRPLDPALDAIRRRRRKRRRLTTTIVSLVVLAGVGTYVPLTLTTPVAAAAVTLKKADVAAPAAVALSVPQVGESAVSISGADDLAAAAGTNGILAANGGSAALPIASISKIITALVVLQAKPIDGASAGPNITFTKANHDLYDTYYAMGAAIEPMNTGWVMSERDAITTMLVPSACNYADVLSTWAFGTRANFLAAVSKFLASHGLTNTKLVEPTGMDPRNVSTPTDLIAIGKLAMANPVIASIVNQPNPTVANIGPLVNTNELLGTDGVNGIKTGTLEKSDLLFSAQVDVGASTPLSIVGAVLGGDSHESIDAEVRTLIASIKSGFHKVPLIASGTVLGTYTTPWKDDATIVAGDSASALTWSNTPITSSMTTKTVTSAASGSNVGTVTYLAGKAKVTVPLKLKGAIKAPDAWWRLTHPLEVLGIK